jgi:hypothetical protein
MSDLLERFNTIASLHAIPEGIFRVNEGYRLLFTSDTEDGLRVILFINMGGHTMGLIYLPEELTSSK